MEEWFIDRFVASFKSEPHHLTLDIDTFDDPTHVDYTVGYQMNPTTRKASETLLKAAVAAYQLNKRPVREFMSMDYKATRWKKVRKVVIKCEVNAQGTNRRAVVTNRPGIEISPQGVYDGYADRGESENRN